MRVLRLKFDEFKISSNKSNLKQQRLNLLDKIIPVKAN